MEICKRDKRVIKLYYYNAVQNVGDYFSVYLFKKINPDLNVVYSETPEIVSSGSILDTKLNGNNIKVWGSGFHNHDDVYPENMNFIAVRGELSRSKIIKNKRYIVLGDPGLLASKIYRNKVKKKYKFGICSHYIDTDYFLDNYSKRDDINLILMNTNDVENVLNEINKCEMIFSSSLHGIIFAHSYGIPAIHIENIPLASKKNYKFYDYYSSIGLKYEKHSAKNVNFDELFSKREKFVPNVKIIQSLQNNLINSFPYKNKCVICCIAKNENNYILEWVEYHIKLGFEHIYIFDNNEIGDDSLSNLLKNYKNITIFNARGKIEKGLQKKLYTKFYNDFKLSFSWCLFSDIDEFLVLKKWNNINEMVDDLNFAHTQSITFGWRLYGSDGKCRRKNNKVFEQFHNEILNKFNQKKVMIKGNIDNVVFNSVHYASTDDKEVLDQMTPDYGKTDDKIDYSYRDENAYINHYMTKTLKEFINQRLYQGDANLHQTIDLNYFFKINKKTLKYRLCLLYLKIIKKRKF